MSDTPEDRIARCRELDAKATKGPWEFWDNESNQLIVANVKGKGDDAKGNVIAALGGISAKTPEFQLIAEYRTLAPLLATELTRTREALRVMRGALEWSKIRVEYRINSKEQLGGDLATLEKINTALTLANSILKP